MITWRPEAAQAATLPGDGEQVPLMTEKQRDADKESAAPKRFFLVLPMSPPLHPAALGVLVLALLYASFMAFGTMHPSVGLTLAIVAFVTLYLAACMALNSLRIELDPARLRISYGPLWQPGGKVVSTAAIEKIEPLAYTLAVDRGSLSEEDRWSNPPPATRVPAWDLLIMHARNKRPVPLRLQLRALREQDAAGPASQLNAALQRIRSAPGA
jgi:hypothetical protein